MNTAARLTALATREARKADAAYAALMATDSEVTGERSRNAADFHADRATQFAYAAQIETL